MASNEWLVRKLHEQDKKIEALSRGGTGVGHSSIAPGENLTVISDNGEVVLGAGGVEHVDGPTPATPSAPTLKLGFGTIETTWDGSFAEGEDEDGVPLTAPVDFDVVEVHCSTDPEEEEWGDDTMRGQIKTREGGTITVGGFDVDDEVFVCLIALAKTGKRSAPSATASLVIEGLDFSQLFNELDAANATIKNAGEILVTEQGTLDEKLTEVDGTLNDLGQDLQAVEDAQAQLNTDLSDVMTSVDGKNTITWNPSAPSPVSTPGKAVGDLWYRTSGNNIIGFWKWDGTDWVTQLLDVTTIPLIDIGAGTFGSLNGARLVAGSVAASTVAVGDFSNLATIDPIRGINVTRPAGFATQIIGDWVTSAPGITYLMFKDRTNTVPFKPGDTLRFFFRAKNYLGSNFQVQPALWVYPLLEDGATTGLKSANGSAITIVPGEGQTYTGTVNIPASFDDGVIYKSWIIGLRGYNGGSTQNLGVRDVTMYRASGNTLIQDGAISTDKLATNVLEVGNLKAGSAAINSAVVNKIWAEAVVAKMVTATEFIGENAILTGAVTAPKITASEELWAKIAQFVKIRAEHIEADAIDGMVITGATIRSAATGARTLMSASGFEAYDNTGKRTFFASASTGDVSMTGELYTGEPGSERVVLDNALWDSVKVYDESGGYVGSVGGSGVRIGPSTVSSIDMYHGSYTDGSGSNVDMGKILAPRGLASIDVSSGTAPGSSTFTRGWVLANAYDGAGDRAARLTVSSTRRMGQLSGYDTSGRYRATVSAWGDSANAQLAAYDTAGATTASVDTVGGGYVNVSGAHVTPLIVNYSGTDAAWNLLFRKGGTSWGYVGSPGAMGVDDFGIQSASGKNLALVATGASNIEVSVDNGAGGRFRVPSIYNVTSSGSANVVVNGQGTLYRPSSSKRYKQDIEGFTPKPDILDIETKTWRDIRAVEDSEKARDYLAKIGQGPLPVEFQDTELEPPRHFGAIAEEVHDMGLTELVEYDSFGRPDALKYPMFGVALIPSIRALRDRITELERLTNE